MQRLALQLRRVAEGAEKAHIRDCLRLPQGGSQLTQGPQAGGPRGVLPPCSGAQQLA